MEFVLLPSNRGNPRVPVPRTPYVCQQRYDGGPFLSYPIRVGKAEAGAAFSDNSDYQRAERVNPTPICDQESFIQTWLYFGLISEFLLANTEDVADNSSETFDISSSHSRAREILGMIYDIIVIHDADQSYVVLDESKLNRFMEIARPRLPEDRDARNNHCDHLLSCLALAHQILASLPRGFNHEVKYSIRALCELFAQTVRSVLSIMGVQRIFGRGWAVGFLDQEAKDSMAAHGWCPSDIARAEANFLSIQSVNVIRFMDKSLGQSDHSRCTDVACNSYQINMDEYQVDHEEADCLCEKLEVDSKDLDRILAKDDCVPLLQFQGDVHNLKVELVESADNTPFIAISHVWADGLGNPHANSLHRCKLVHLQELVTAMHSDSNPGESSKAPLIWLDTLCCPAKDGEGKQKAIEKIRLVYQRAEHVLVLDSGLMAYESKSQEVHEKVVRIFTSGWVRRLWTLQEGSLAKSLYFQFADEAISLRALHQRLLESCASVRYQVFTLDATQEFFRLDAFFRSDHHNVPGDWPNLIVLDQALQFRSVSVATDEALCIGTLMSLDLAAILAVRPKEDRMQKVWELLALKYGGISTDLIFFEEDRIDAPGWRWAPRSLLSIQKSIHQANVRKVRWAGSQLGQPTPRGLRAQYPGFEISVKRIRDGRPRNPWPGMTRIPEAYIHFRDEDTGKWYRIADNEYGLISQSWTTDEDRREYNKLKRFPLHDMADTDKAVAILKENISTVNPSALQGGIFARRVTNEVPQSLEDGVAVNIKRYIIVSTLAPEDAYIHATMYTLALRLRDDELTNKHLALHQKLEKETASSTQALETKILEDEDFKTSIKVLTEKMKKMTREVVAEDSRFVAAVKMYFGDSFLDDMWVLIKDWFNHDYVGKMLPEEQVWFVD